jgi:hypothetical protein
MIIFEPIFGDIWQSMPAVFHKHYAIRQNSQDSVMVEGKMLIKMSKVFKILAPIMKLAGLLVPYEGAFETKVIFTAEDDNFHFNRIFTLPNNKTYHFCSTLMPQGGNLVYEKMNFGFIWASRFIYAEDKVQIIHESYRFNLFGKSIRLPLELMLGKGNAYEIAIDDDNFKMKMTIEHPIFGLIYGYEGQFKVSEINNG